MNKTINNILVFVAGAAVGSLITWKMSKTYYARIAQEEIDSVKERFSQKAAERTDDQNEDFADIKKKLDEYNNLLHESGYVRDDDEEGDAMMIDDGPYVISPDEFGELTHETITYTYYADGILADEVDDVVDDIEGTIGCSSLLHFGEYEDDCVHVRNDRLETDYEILLDTRSYYGDIVPSPRPADE